MAPKSPAPAQGVRRSSRASTPTTTTSGQQRATSPRLASSSSTPSLSASLAPPPPSSVRKSSSTRQLSPRPVTPSHASSGNNPKRPPLPKHLANSLMQDHNRKVHKVKLQVLTLGQQGDTITIARVKCPVPKGVPGHIIKRYDTNAVSASSLYRAAFPLATAEEEQLEMNWLAKGAKGKYGDTKQAGWESSPDHKLTGTWIPANKAADLALEYGILRYAKDLIEHQEEGTTTTAAASAGAGARAGAGADSLQVPDSEGDSPALRSPRTKRARLASPPTSSSRSPTTRSSAASASVSIHQTLSSSTTSEGEVVTEEQTVVEVDTAEPEEKEEEGEDKVEKEIQAAKDLVQSLKEAGALKSSSTTTTSSSSFGMKRALEQEEEEAQDEQEQQEQPRAGFFGRLLGRDRGNEGGAKKRQPRSAPTSTRRARAFRGPPLSEAVEVGQQLMVVEREEVEGRRWVAGFGLALAVGATAVAPYLFG